MVRYTGPRGQPGSSTGGHYTAYVRSEAGGWVLHDDVYTYARAPVLDDPANTAALYVRQDSPVVEPRYQVDTSGMMAPTDPNPSSLSPSPDVTLSQGGPPDSGERQDQPTASQPPSGRQGGAQVQAAGAGVLTTARPGKGGETGSPTSNTQNQPSPRDEPPGQGPATDSAYSSSTTEGSQFS